MYMVTSSSWPQVSGFVARARPARAAKRMLLTILIYVLVQAMKDCKVESGSERSSKTVAKESLLAVQQGRSTMV